MKEIKFRAYKILNPSEFVEFTLEDVLRGKVVFAYPEHRKFVRFTNLEDKNGKEIYEGDIVRYKPYNNLGHENDFNIGEVIWGETGDSDGWSHGKHYEFVVNVDSLADIADSDYPDEASCEVIGNIYENPKLLEK